MPKVDGMYPNTKRIRDELGIVRHCATCTNCWLCIKSEQYQLYLKERKNKGASSDAENSLKML